MGDQAVVTVEKSKRSRFAGWDVMLNGTLHEGGFSQRSAAVQAKNALKRELREAHESAVNTVAGMLQGAR